MKSNRLSYQRKKQVAVAVRYAGLTVMALIILFPMIWMLLSSFKDATKIASFPPQLWPNPFKPENYPELFNTQKDFPLYFWNSTYIAVVVTAGNCLIATMAGYAFAKIQFPFRNTIFLLLLSSMMIPSEATQVPMYKWFSSLGLVNTHAPLIFPAMFGGMFGLFLMRQSFLNMPSEFIEAAKIDGCSQLRIFFSICLPLSTSAISTLCIMTFLNRWNDFVEPLIYLNSQKLYTLPLALSLLTDGVAVPWNLIMVASVLSCLPLLIVFFIAQNKFIDSVAMSGVKG